MGKINDEVALERRSEDQRSPEDRRQADVDVQEDRRQSPRRKVQRRRQIDPTTCERDYSNDEIEFMQALDAYKRANGRMFPTCSEILEVVRGMGYVRLDPEDRLNNGEPTGDNLPEETDFVSDAIDQATENE